MYRRTYLKWASVILIVGSSSQRPVRSEGFFKPSGLSGMAGSRVVPSRPYSSIGLAVQVLGFCLRNWRPSVKSCWLSRRIEPLLLRCSKWEKEDMLLKSLRGWLGRIGCWKGLDCRNGWDGGRGSSSKDISSFCLLPREAKPVERENKFLLLAKSHSFLFQNKSSDIVIK